MTSDLVLLALVGDVYCIFVTFSCDILGQVWYLIVSLPDLCLFLTMKCLSMLSLVLNGLIIAEPIYA